MKVCLVIPAYNEAKRLNRESFANFSSFQFLFVDDGSTDGTAAIIDGWNLPNCRVLVQPQNQGKAEAVRAGMLEAEASGCEWIGFWDADLATPLEEVENALKYIETFFPNFDSVWCSRLMRLGSDIKRSPLRHVLGRFFVTVVSLLFNDHVYDTQCGAKIFRKAVVRQLFQEKFISRWVFDVEILQRAKSSQMKIVEYPLTTWKDIAGSKVRIGRTSIRVLSDLSRIKKKYA